MTKPMKCYSKGGKVANENANDEPRTAYYNDLTGKIGEPEGYDSRDGNMDSRTGYEPPGFPAPQHRDYGKGKR
jgi:hypothetical protein